MHSVVLPELGEGIQKATVACWHCREGERVAAGDDVVEVVTDKATFNVSADTSGTVKEILIKEGQDAGVGEPLLLLDVP